VAEQFSLFEMPPFTPRFNIAPSQPVAVVRVGNGAAAWGREIVWMRWGLVPSWAKDPEIGNRLINARSETAPQKPAFRAAFRRRRCLIAADGFYEWQGKRRPKQPFFIRRTDDRPFAFAGLWESWEGADHSGLQTCTILTTEPNELIRPIHNRMPVIVSAEHYDRWLDPAQEKTEGLMELLRPYPPGELELYPVALHVNSPTNDDPRCIEPLPDDGRLPGF